jgi:hypothetical protein
MIRRFPSLDAATSELEIRKRLLVLHVQLLGEGKHGALFKKIAVNGLSVIIPIAVCGRARRKAADQ